MSKHLDSQNQRFIPLKSYHNVRVNAGVCVCVCVFTPPTQNHQTSKSNSLGISFWAEFRGQNFPETRNNKQTKGRSFHWPLKRPWNGTNDLAGGWNPYVNYYMGPQETQLNPMRISNHVSFLLLAYKQQFPLPQKSTPVLEATKQSGSTNGSPLISIGPRMMHNCFASQSQGKPPCLTKTPAWKHHS